MTKYIFIESRDPFESRDTRFVVETASSLKYRGHQVTVFFVQNGVLAARKNARGTQIAHLVEAGVRLLADDFSLSERGIQRAELSTHVHQSNVEAIVDELAQENTKAIWH
jgi:sulfur relay (sulfurtransferase) DsrF/TusC family protein